MQPRPPSRTSGNSSPIDEPAAAPPVPSHQRILHELNRSDAQNGGDAHFIVRLMHSIGGEMAARATSSSPPRAKMGEVSSSTSSGAEASSFAREVIKSKRFFSLVSAHIGGDLDGWGAATGLVFVTVQCLACVVLIQPSVSWLFVTLATQQQQQQQQSSSGENDASRTLNRIVALASACPQSIISDMSSPPPPPPPMAAPAAAAPPSKSSSKSAASVAAAAALTSSSSKSSSTLQPAVEQQPHSLQTEGEILCWYTAWEFLVGLVSACGPEVRLMVQKCAADLGRHKALRQSAAVLVAFLKNESKAVPGTKPPTCPNRVMLHTAKEFVEKMSM